MIPGAAKAMRRLAALRKRELKKAIRKSSRAGAKIVQADVQRSLPQRSGTLVKAIKVRALPRSRRWVGAQVTVKVQGDKPYYAGFVELGTKRQKGQRKMLAAKQRSGPAAVSVVTAEIRRVVG